MSIVRHSFYNFVGAAAPVAVSLFTVPVYLRVVGLDRYGILSLCWLVVGYFNFFDFGLGRATAQRIASLEESTNEARARAFWTGVSLSIGLALVSVLVAWPLARLALGSIKSATPELRLEVQAALPLLIGAIPIAIMQSSLRGALEGRREFFAVNVIVSGGAVATGVVPLLAALDSGPALSILIGASLGVRLIVLLAYGLCCVRAVPIRNFVRPTGEDVRKMLHFGAWLTVSKLLSFMVYVDRFFIGSLVGAAAVALYVIPFNLISQLLLIPSSLSNALFPRLAASPESKLLTRQAMLETAFLLTPLSLCVMVAVGPFLKLWIGADAAAHSTPVAWVLACGFWANGLAQLPYAGIQAAGRTDLTAKLHLAETVPYLLLLWIGLSSMGVLGAAIAWSVRAIVDFIALAVIDEAGWPVLRPILLQGTPLVALALIFLTLHPGSLDQWLASAAVLGGAGAYLLASVPQVSLDRIAAIMRRLRLS